MGVGRSPHTRPGEVAFVLVRSLEQSASVGLQTAC